MEAHLLLLARARGKADSMAKMRAVVISKPGAAFQMIERDIPTPKAR
jgi:hypothetical protein